MRDILFRGKREDNGEWVYGAFLNDRDGSFYICPDLEGIDISYIDGSHRYIGCWYKVDPDTVGQYTGQKDRDGNRIFEGDILILRSSIPHVVKFEDGEFVLENTAISIRYADKFKVIGNIHDNPNFVRGE